MSQLKEITIVTQAGGEQTIRLQNYDNTKDIEYWNDNDKAISGKIRQNIRGSRGRYHLRYEASVQPTTFRSVFNNVVDDLTSGEEDITIIEDGSYRVVVPTENFLHNISYAQQIGEFVPDMEFVDSGLNRFDSRYVETGYVDEGYVE